MRTPKFWMLSFMLLALLFSCKKDTDDNGINDNNNQPEEKYKPWTQNEIDLIMSGEAHEPMRILLVDDLEDSLFLRTPTIDIKPDATDPVLRRLAERMLVTMNESGGVGIAGPQVGIGRSVFWFKRFDLPEKPFQFIIDPNIVFASERQIKFPWDGCLSMPGYGGSSTRHSSIFVEYYILESGKEKNIFEGYSSTNFTSVCFQHEYDHLQGILFTDRVDE